MYALVAEMQPLLTHTRTHVYTYSTNFRASAILGASQGHLCLAAIISPTAVVIRLNNKI